MKRLTHAMQGRTHDPRTDEIRYACGALELWRSKPDGAGYVAITRATLSPEYVTCEACRHALEEAQP